MTVFDEIIQFNKKRNLYEFNVDTEVTSLDEEIIELQDAETEYDQVDAFADIIVFAVGALHKLGYNPEKVLAETLKEINSRQGSIDKTTGKWEKDKNQSKDTLYKADYSQCK